MKTLLTLITAAVFVSGCSSTQHARMVTSADLHQAAKTQYYEDLNQRRYIDNIDAFAEIDEKSERDPAEAGMLVAE